MSCFMLLVQNHLRALSSLSLSHFDHHCQAGQRGPGGCEHHRGPSAVSAPGRGFVPALGSGPGAHGGQRAQCESHDLGRGDPDIRVQHTALLQLVTGTEREKLILVFIRLLCFQAQEQPGGVVGVAVMLQVRGETPDSGATPSSLHRLVSKLTQVQVHVHLFCD